MPTETRYGSPTTSPLVRLLRLRDVVAVTGLCKTRLYDLAHVGQFPVAVRLHGRAVAWRSDEIEQWIAARPRAGRTPEKTNAPAVAAEASISAR